MVVPPGSDVATVPGREGTASSPDHPFDGAAMNATETLFFEPGGARMVGFDRGADALQRGDDALPRVGDSRRVGRDEPQGGTAGQGFPQSQAGADAVGLGGGGGLTDQGLAADLGSERERARREGFAPTGGDRQLEAWEEDADDHVSNTCSHWGRTPSRDLSQSRPLDPAPLRPLRSQ